jgi:cytochrome c5
LLFVLVLAGCEASKKAAYEFPEAMLPHVKAEYSKICDRGQALYNNVCSGCHNTGSKRRPVIPDFKPEALTGYALRISNGQHERNMPDSLITEEELGVIMTFLSYKKKNKADK